MNNVIINNKPYTKDSKGFYIMPNELHFLLTDLGLTAQEKLIYECLVRYSNNSENNPFPSYSTLQKFASCGRNTVAKGLKNLQEYGLVEVLEKGSNLTGKSNTYKIRYVYENTQEASETVEVAKDIKSLPAKKQLQKKPMEKGNRKKSGMDEETVIPFNRGIHADVVTSKEAKERLRYWESAEAKKQLEEDEQRMARLFDL
ncbi:helix-turn-helix domain-containing protein [Clostridium celatum]|uniref:helix-turn-helix domain-containing protein n=1 Tax=Clostridium celatum TaxID=36834 RepID=UPI00189B2750|nr:helix-turn-helix domain-containing protein [Clostridium celatum]